MHQSDEKNQLKNCKEEISEIIDLLLRRYRKVHGPHATVTFDFIENIIIRVIIRLRLKKLKGTEVSPEAFLKDYPEAEMYVQELCNTFLQPKQKLILVKVNFSHVLGSLHECLVERNKKRKKHGIYYTPEYIVKEMCAKTVKAYLHTTLRNLKQAIEIQDWDRVKLILNSLAAYRMLDPACGSGAFLVHIYQLLAQFYKKLFRIVQQCGYPWEVAKEEGNLASYIVEKHIRGFDLDEDAVVLTRLALYYYGLDLCNNNHYRFFDLLNNAVVRKDSLLGEVDGQYNLIIGNPPYIANKSIPQRTKLMIKRKFETAVGQFDTIVPFLEMGVNHLKEGGTLCFILSNKYMAADYGTALRRWLLEETSIIELVDLSAERIFPDAAIYPVVMVLKKQKSKSTVNKVRIISDAKVANIPQTIFKSLGNHVFTTGLSEDLLKPLEKILAWKGRVLAKDIRCGLAATGFNKAITDGPAEGLVGILMAGEIGDFALKGPKGYYPEGIISRKQKALFNKTKLLVPGISKNLKAAIDFSGNALGRVYFIPLGEMINEDRLYYLQALYNSVTVNFLYRVLYWPVHLSGGYLRINSTYLAEMPIPYWEQPNLLSFPQTRKVITISRKITTEADCLLDPKTRGELEEAVFELYNLSPTEAEIITRETNISKEALS